MIDQSLAVSIRNLGKKYLSRRTGSREFWALRGVNLSVKKGQVWGIIGRNGAGKSTLLKLLSRVTRQTEGEFLLNGRVHALLELGMGFHEELNGIENLYVSGSLQGLSREFITENLDEIVAFSGVGDAVYQPLRTYSSGMKVRLAFALAMHAKPDILILDEILAVGDEIFQRKCFEVIRNFITAGVTVLFVSHDMKLVSLICDHCLLLHQGKIIDQGSPDDVIDSYARIMGPSFSRGDVAVTKAQYYLQLFYRNFSITKRFGMYCSVRSNRVWYDPAYILWDQEEVYNDHARFQGHYITMPLQVIWELRFAAENVIKWKVIFQVSEAVRIDRFQANLMLTPNFTSWFTDMGDQHDFPKSFRYDIGEDWDRHWIGPAGSNIGAQVKHHRYTGSVEFSAEPGPGSMVVVSSTPVFKAHLLQYLRTWQNNEKLPPGEHVMADMTIRLSPSVIQ